MKRLALLLLPVLILVGCDRSEEGTGDVQPPPSGRVTPREERKAPPPTTPPIKRAERPEPGNLDLALNVTREGVLTIDGREFVDLGKFMEKAGTWINPQSKFIDLLEARFERRIFREQRGGRDVAAYALFINLDPEARFEFAQITLALAAQRGRLYKSVLLVKGREDHVWVHLPLNPDPQAERIRVILCADGKISEHADNRVEHSKAEKTSETVVVAMAGRELTRLSVDPAADNSGAMEKAVEVISEFAGSKEGVPIILDADEEVPSRLAIGLLSALREAGLSRFELVGTPRLPR